MKTDFRQNTLFGQKIISSIGFDEQEILRDILYLHTDGKVIDCDPTFSVGNFYKKGIPAPVHKFDKTPTFPGVIGASSDNLPLDSNSINVIMFDPPFVIGGENYQEAKNGSSIIAKRFTSFKNFEELKTMYSESLKEFSRVLRDQGIVIFKCQDVVVSQKNHFTHCWIMYEAIRNGFYPKDLFILLARARLTDGRVQQHARKYHSYFWVLKKETCKVEYFANTGQNLST